MNSKLILDILPKDILVNIMTYAPQLGLSCKELYKEFPKLNREDNLGVHFPSSHTDPKCLIKIHHGELTFVYGRVPDISSYTWDGISPQSHFDGVCDTRTCDFCKKTHSDVMSIGKTFRMGGLIFVCSQCNRGFQTRLKEIIGETLWRIHKMNQQIMVPRINGPNEMWYLHSEVPLKLFGKWHACVRSHLDTEHDECMTKVVLLETLDLLNKEVPA